MKKAIIILMVLFIASCDNTTTSVHNIIGKNVETVYVCTGPSSHCYHKNRRCEGLENCSRTVEAVSINEAIKWGRRPCGYCY